MHVQDLTEYEPIITFRGRKVWLMTSFKVNLVHSHRPVVLLHLSLYMRVSRHRYTPGGQLVVNLHLQPWMCQRIHSIWSQQSLATNSHWGLLSLPITLKCYSPFEGILDLHNISSFTQTPDIYWFVLRKYQSREKKFHLSITLTQQNPNILLHTPIQKILKIITN